MRFCAYNKNAIQAVIKSEIWCKHSGLFIKSKQADAEWRDVGLMARQYGISNLDCTLYCRVVTAANH